MRRVRNRAWRKTVIWRQKWFEWCASAANGRYNRYYAVMCVVQRRRGTRQPGVCECGFSHLLRQLRAQAARRYATDVVCGLGSARHVTCVWHRLRRRMGEATATESCTDNQSVSFVIPATRAKLLQNDCLGTISRKPLWTDRGSILTIKVSRASRDHVGLCVPVLVRAAQSAWRATPIRI